MQSRVNFLENKRMKNKVISIFLVVVTALAVALCCVGCNDDEPPIDNTEASKNHDKIYLYQSGNVPYDEDCDCSKYVFITPYLAAKPTGGAVIVFPGGGYNHLSNATNKGGADNDGDQKESSAIAEWYNAAGISVFIVNYRTTSVHDDADYRQILSDGTRAIKFVRHNAAQYYVDVNKIAVQGYSAGGHLAATLLTTNFSVNDENYVADAVDGESAKVNAAVLCYAVTSLKDEITHKGTKSVFCGEDQSVATRCSPVDNVTANTAPCFLWCHEGDRTVSSRNTYAMAEALDAKGVHYSINVFDDGGTTQHGVGVAQEYQEAKEWPSLATEFLQALGF